ncbi:MAG: SUMF1/EgtB/PvdO family nonheme iron enzyme [Bacteroidales bacterium]|nr:SUMF1/EgtB/PvdO family nonheme iron enzyme [Bacteroidales bacterium]
MRKKNFIKSLLATFCVSLLLVSCGKEHSASRTTGWNYNDPENGGFNVVDAPMQITGPGLVAIEGGTFTMGATTENPYYEWNNNSRQVTVSSFYMDQTEVSNLDYLEYIHWLKRVYGSDYPEMVNRALPDTLVWRTSLTYNEPMVEIYFRHPAYRDYPVVGVTWLQANEYALWRSDRVNEKLLVDAGALSYNNNQSKDNYFSTDAYLAGTYVSTVNNATEVTETMSGESISNDLYADSTSVNTSVNAGNSTDNFVNPSENLKMEDGIILPKYRLPTEAEWEYAALGLIGNTQNEVIMERKVYPWNTDGLRSNIYSFQGSFIANFKRGKGDYMGVAGSLNDGSVFPAPVATYWPNDYGLFNMAGNVSEWVLDVYRPLSYEDFNDYNPYRGDFIAINNIPDSLLTDVTNDSIMKILHETYNLNYKDGDYMSILNYETAPTKPSEAYTSSMYDYGKTTLISDKSRVYKGGSWADGPYYLSPSIRRFMNEDESSSTVGFRCAMNKIGNALAR